MVYFHVRTADGVTLDWERNEAAMQKLAKEVGALLYRVDASTGRTERIR